jgi:hypothetical protein
MDFADILTDEITDNNDYIVEARPTMLIIGQKEPGGYRSDC